MLVRGVFYFLHQYCMLWINMKVLYRLRDESFTSLMKQSLAFYNTVKQGELIQTVANQTKTPPTPAASFSAPLSSIPSRFFPSSRWW